MNRTISAICVAGFIAGCASAPATVDHVPVYVLAAAEVDGPDFAELRYYRTAEECLAAAEKEQGTDTSFFCIKR